MAKKVKISQIQEFSLPVRNYISIQVLAGATTDEDSEGKYFTGSNNFLNAKNHTPDIVFEPNTVYSLKFRARATGGNPRIGFRYTDGTSDYRIFNSAVTQEFVISSNPNKTVSYIRSSYGSAGTWVIYDDIIAVKGTSFPKEWIPALEDQIADWNEQDDSRYSFVKNKPVVPTNYIRTDNSGVALQNYSGIDANNITGSCVLYVTNGTNVPFNGGVLETYIYSTGGYQRYSGFNQPDQVYMRNKMSGVWGAWYQIASREYVDEHIQTSIEGLSLLSFQVVSTLPATGQTNVIYLVPNGGSSPNIKDEYIWVGGQWELIGTTEIDLSGYVPNTGNTSVAGTKTFSSIPVLPSSNPTTNNQATRKGYVDATVAANTNGAIVMSTTQVIILEADDQHIEELETNFMYISNAIDATIVNIPLPSEQQGKQIQIYSDAGLTVRVIDNIPAVFLDETFNTVDNINFNRSVVKFISDGSVWHYLRN